MRSHTCGVDDQPPLRYMEGLEEGLITPRIASLSTSGLNLNWTMWINVIFFGYVGR